MPQGIEHPAMGGGAEPPGRVVRHAGCGPLGGGLGEGLCERVLDEVGAIESRHQVAQQQAPMAVPEFVEDALRHGSVRVHDR
ncbi:hypothetical protein [Pseudactinotalea sp. Z1748]|uniref:hypothetical protein n=1 Tax=Pseudactinotalea sp. Z1748 TaxID=3413027 RepID=UPI003C7CF719